MLPPDDRIFEKASSCGSWLNLSEQRYFTPGSCRSSLARETKEYTERNERQL